MCKWNFSSWELSSFMDGLFSELHLILALSQIIMNVQFFSTFLIVVKPSHRKCILTIYRKSKQVMFLSISAHTEKFLVSRTQCNPSGINLQLLFANLEMIALSFG